MKVGMYVTGGGKDMCCMFICSKCGKPITNLEEANFAPVENQWADPKKLSRELWLQTDEVEIWHWDCDEAGVPWINAAAAFRGYFEKKEQRRQRQLA